MISSFLIFRCHRTFWFHLKHFIWNTFSLSLSFFLNVQVYAAYVKTLITHTFSTLHSVAILMSLLFHIVLNLNLSLNILAAVNVPCHNTSQIFKFLYIFHNNSVKLPLYWSTFWLPNTTVFVLLKLIFNPVSCSDSYNADDSVICCHLLVLDQCHLQTRDCRSRNSPHLTS